jgi:hypothetical protein
MRLAFMVFARLVAAVVDVPGTKELEPAEFSNEGNPEDDGGCAANPDTAGGADTGEELAVTADAAEKHGNVALGEVEQEEEEEEEEEEEKEEEEEEVACANERGGRGVPGEHAEEDDSEEEHSGEEEEGENGDVGVFGEEAEGDMKPSESDEGDDGVVPVAGDAASARNGWNCDAGATGEGGCGTAVTEPLGCMVVQRACALGLACVLIFQCLLFVCVRDG